MTLEQAQIAELQARRNMWVMVTWWLLTPLLGVLGGIVVLVGWGIAVVT